MELRKITKYWLFSFKFNLAELRCAQSCLQTHDSSLTAITLLRCSLLLHEQFP